MLSIKDHHEEKLIKLYRRFEPEVKEKILELMEFQAKNAKRKKGNHSRREASSVGERINKNLEAYLQGDYIILTKDNLDEYFAK